MEQGRTIRSSENPEEVIVKRDYGNVTLADNAALHQGDIFNIHYHNRDQEATASLRAFYYKTMHDRKNQILSAQVKTCEWIWSSSFCHWLADPSSHVFWISGKPGSGKSTLMKYLACPDGLHSHSTGTIVRRTVLQFFFDFRRESELENSVEGLLKTLLHQIAPLAQSVLKDIDDTADLSLEDLSGLFREALKAAAASFILLIDGLDEFHGSHNRLLQHHLLPIASLENVKMCFASRPEPMILHHLRNTYTLALSDHNGPGIDNYIDAAIEKFEPDLAQLNFDVRRTIHVAAGGVFIWVVLALEEIVEACVSGSTDAEIRMLTKSLPLGVENMYARILKRMPESRKEEAAILFTLVAEAQVPMTLDLLRASIYFLAHEMRYTSLPDTVMVNKLFAKRLRGTMGGLLEICSDMQENASFLAGHTEVRLMHETVNAFAQKTRHFEKMLPATFRVDFPSSVWLRICCKALSISDLHLDRDEISISNVPKSLPNGRVDYSPSFISMLRKCGAKHELENWARLLHHSINFLTLYTQKHLAHGHTDFWTEIEEGMSCPIAKLHLHLFDAQSTRYLSKAICLDHCLDDVLIAILHRCYRYLSIVRPRLAALAMNQRHELVRWVVATKIRHCWYQEQMKDIQSTVIAKQRAVGTILEMDEQLQPIHLLTYMNHSIAEWPTYLARHMGQRLDKSSGTTLDELEGRQIHEPLLFHWAVSKTDVNSDGLKLRQLQTLLMFGVDINEKSVEGKGVVAYLLERIPNASGGQNRLLDWDYYDNAGYETTSLSDRLYDLETCFADFACPEATLTWHELVETSRHKLESHISAKMASKQIYKRVRYGEHADGAMAPPLGPSPDYNPGVCEYMLELETLLKHKHVYGHLPQPQRRPSSTFAHSQTWRIADCVLCKVQEEESSD